MMMNGNINARLAMIKKWDISDTGNAEMNETKIIYKYVRHTFRYLRREIYSFLSAAVSDWVVDFIKKAEMKGKIYLLMIELKKKREND